MANPTAINLLNTDGSLIDLSRRILELKPTLNNDSVVDLIATPITEASFVGDIKKKIKREQFDYVEGTLIGLGARDLSASSPAVASVTPVKKYRTDNIIASRLDLAKLNEGKGGDIIALEVADFILTAKEKDLNFLLADAKTKAGALKIWTSAAKVNTGDAYATSPTGVQPTAATDNVADVVTAINGGARNVTVGDLTTTDHAMRVIRAALGYLNEIGAPESPEALYPHSINGIPLNELVILSKYKYIVNIKDSLTTTVVNLNDPGTARNLNGLVAYIDTVRVVMTNQLAAKEAFKVLSSRVFARGLDPLTQYIGVINENASGTLVKIKDGSTRTVLASEILVIMESGRALATVYPEEIFTISLT